MTIARRSEETAVLQPTSERRGPAWLQPALARVDALIDESGAPLDSLLRSEVHLVLRRHGVTSLVDLVLGGAATPFVPLLDALAVDLGFSANDPRLISIGEATLLAWLQVRLQDDLVDEPDAWGRDAVYGVEALSCASVAAFCEACRDQAPAFFRVRATVMSRFSATALEEVACRDANRALASARIADKFLPLAPCLAALAFTAQRPWLAEPLVRLVLTLGEALQTANDLLNVAEDFHGKRRTPVLDALTAEGAVFAPIRLSLLSSQTMERALAHAREALEHATALARRFELPRLERVIGSRAAFLDSVPGRLFQLQLGGGIS
jgi:hypothetical protein